MLADHVRDVRRVGQHVPGAGRPPDQVGVLPLVVLAGLGGGVSARIRAGDLRGVFAGRHGAGHTRCGEVRAAVVAPRAAPTPAAHLGSHGAPGAHLPQALRELHPHQDVPVHYVLRARAGMFVVPLRRSWRRPRLGGGLGRPRGHRQRVAHVPHVLLLVLHHHDHGGVRRHLGRHRAGAGVQHPSYGHWGVHVRPHRGVHRRRDHEGGGGRDGVPADDGRAEGVPAAQVGAQEPGDPRGELSRAPVLDPHRAGRVEDHVPAARSAALRPGAAHVRLGAATGAPVRLAHGRGAFRCVLRAQDVPRRRERDLHPRGAACRQDVHHPLGHGPPQRVG
mmetsp:Transcript_7508/g.18631  ORF Transcript_7508/g.18631 Transcript_7508/m.18631 type:complete len:334 (+) Transcript_7508:411-1412(+)